MQTLYKLIFYDTSDYDRVEGEGRTTMISKDSSFALFTNNNQPSSQVKDEKFEIIMLVISAF